MQEDAIKKAERLLHSCEDAFARMCEFSMSHLKLESAWTDFLSNSQTFFNVLANGARETRSRTWMQEVMKDRRADELMNYVQQSRHMDAHSSEEPTRRLEGLQFVGRYTTPETKWKTEEMDEMRGRLPTLPSTRYWVKDVVNRGVHYSVPRKHLGKHIDLKTPLEIGYFALQYMSKVLESAKTQVTKD